ncbi:MAG: chain-length determining protein [Gammaproteobacteria bacterium]|nr:chain-length determining protein [Gammaproteobacteria bacterium]
MKQFLRKNPYWMVCVVAMLAACGYWAWLATPRYVSEAHIVLDSSEVSISGFNLASMVSGAPTGKDLLLLRDHLLSVDMLNTLEATLGLRAHYADPDIDWLSRLSAVDVPQERFHEYFRSRVRIELDEYAGVLRIRVQAFTPDKAQAIAKTLLEAGERHMNGMSQRLAQEQVTFMEAQVDKLGERLSKAREALLEFQNTHGLVSPTSTVENIAVVTARLEGELAHLRARRNALSAYQSVRSADMIRLDSEIAALRRQIDLENSRLATSKGDALNRVSAEYETLRLQAQFALDMYSNALAALESTRVEAIRKMKQVSVLQQPTLPEYAMEPRRLYNSTLFCILALMVTGILNLLLAIVRDHRD